MLALPSFDKFISKMCRARAKAPLCSLVIFFFFALPLAAQSADSSGPKRQMHRTHNPASAADRVKALAKTLDLDESQQAAITKILEERREEALRLRSDSSISGSERIESFRQLQDRTVMRIRAVLNEEQKKKYDPLAVRKVAPAPDQLSVEDWLKATTPK
jgi:Spy/CpxP family protein refolding chaperone